jgi:hypothetical protein
MQKHILELSNIDEPHELYTQKCCEIAIEKTLNELRGLILIHDMPLETRLHLISGLGHVRRHIRMETMLITAQVNGRVN